MPACFGFVNRHCGALRGIRARRAGGSEQQGNVMLYRSAIGATVLAALLMTMPGAAAFDESKYPDWSSQWRRPRGVGTQWDQTKPSGLAQQAPLTPRFQAILEASIKDQAEGGQGTDNHVTCRTNGVPRVMTATFPIEFVILPNVTYVHFEAFMPRRIYTDGRDFPKDEEPSYTGYSIGKWLDTDGDGRFDTLEVETRNFKGLRTYENSGLPLHPDNEGIIKERIYLDKDNPDLLHDEITSIDHALTRPWTVTKTPRRHFRGSALLRPDQTVGQGPAGTADSRIPGHPRSQPQIARAGRRLRLARRQLPRFRDAAHRIRLPAH
jgi:hypothetical protein